MGEAVMPSGPPVSRARAGRDIAGQVLLRGLNLALGVGVTVLVVRTLGDRGFGQWSTLLAVVHFVGYLGILGLDQVTVERASAEPGAQPAWLGSLVTLQLALSAPATVLSVAVCLAISDDSAMRVAAVVVCAGIPFSAARALRVAFQLQVRNTITMAIEMANGVAWAVGVVIVAVLDGGLVAIAATFMAVSVATSLATAVIVLRSARVSLRGARDRWPVLLRLGLPVGIGGLLTLGYGYIDQVIVFQIAGAREAGLYGAVYRIYERMQFLPAALMTTLFPIFVAARDTDPERIRRLFRTAVDYLLLTSLPALAIALVGAEPIVRLLFGADFADAAPALPVLMATLVVVSIGYLTGYLIVTYRLQRRFIAIAVAALVLNVTANLALVPAYGFMAAAWVTLGTEVIVMSLSLAIVCRAAGVPPAGANVGRIVAAAIAMGALAWGLRSAGAPLLVWIGAASALYAALLLLSGAVRVGELRALLRRTAV
jgi:O-antigen/teichoic acid export membrane protein